MTENISNKYLYPLGRFLLGLYFLLPGLAKIFLFQENLAVVVEREVPPHVTYPLRIQMRASP